MRAYRLEELTPQEFEELCVDVCTRILGEGFVNFAQGKDGGKDGVFEGKANAFPSEKSPYEGKFIVQAKHTTNPCASCSNSEFDKIVDGEMPKIKKLCDKGELEHYFILTNRKLTGIRHPTIAEKIKTNVPQVTSVSIWGKERISIFLGNNKELLKKFGFDRMREPLRIRPEELKRVVEEFGNVMVSKEKLEVEKLKRDFIPIMFEISGKKK